MVLRPENLPRDPDRLIEMVLACEGKIEALQATITTLKTMIFGARSEKSAVIIAEYLALVWAMPRRTPPYLRPPTTTTRPRPLRDRGTSGTAISAPCPSLCRAAT